MIGKTLAHYQITGSLGKGGMGEVYLAEDSKLRREVAIRVLPDEVARPALATTGNRITSPGSPTASSIS